jgi:hypothetical protein
MANHSTNNFTLNTKNYTLFERSDEVAASASQTKIYVRADRSEPPSPNTPEPTHFFETLPI